MSKLQFTKLVVLLLTSISSSTTFAQVTIGSDTKPNLGALLDLKQEDPITAGE